MSNTSVDDMLFQHPNNTECEGLYADTSSPLFGVVIFISYGAGACFLLLGAVKNIRVSKERLTKMRRKSKNKKKSADTVSRVLNYMAGANCFLALDSMCTAFYFALCPGAVPGDGLYSVLDNMKLFAAMFVRICAYGFLIVSLIVLIVSWLTIVNSAKKMSSAGSKRKGRRQRLLAIVLCSVYVANSFVVMIWFFTGDDPDVNVEKKNLITVMAAAAVLLYMFGISIFAFIYGTRLHKMISILTQKSSGGASTDGGMTKTLRTIHRLMMELSYFALAFFLAINMLGAGFAMGNAWVAALSYLLVILAQHKLVSSMRKSSTIGNKGSSTSRTNQVAPTSTMASSAVSSAVSNITSNTQEANSAIGGGSNLTSTAANSTTANSSRTRGSTTPTSTRTS